MRTRKGVLEIEKDPKDETLEWYSRAVGEMKRRLIADSRSWRWQGAVHGFRSSLVQPGDILPSAEDQKKFWMQCQHGTWFFLPWHRMFLLYFERIVADTVASLKGPRDWALPYWDYSKDPSARQLPESFRRTHWPDKSTNHLFISERSPSINSGKKALDAVDTDLKYLKLQPFTSSPVGLGFGGGQTGFSHFGPNAGGLEYLPHNAVHMAIGGLMADPATAALDPVFWAHHSNIDRLWEVWIQRDSAHTNPTVAAWLKNLSFSFKDESGTEVDLMCEQVLDTKALDYEYDDTSDPIKTTKKTFAPMTPHPQLVTALPQPLKVGGAEPAVHGKLRAAASPYAGATQMLAVDGEPTRFYAHFDNITSDEHVQALDVYIGVPDGEDPTEHEDRFAGRLGLFGLVEASTRDDRRSGDGLRFVLDVTDLLSAIPMEQTADGFIEIPISIRRVGEQTAESMRIGRVSLYAE